MITRRLFTVGLVTAPAVVRAASIMRVKSIVIPMTLGSGARFLIEDLRTGKWYAITERVVTEQGERLTGHGIVNMSGGWRCVQY